MATRQLERRASASDLLLTEQPPGPCGPDRQKRAWTRRSRKRSARGRVRSVGPVARVVRAAWLPALLLFRWAVVTIFSVPGCGRAACAYSPGPSRDGN